MHNLGCSHCLEAIVGNFAPHTRNKSKSEKTGSRKILVDESSKLRKSAMHFDLILKDKKTFYQVCKYVSQSKQFIVVISWFSYSIFGSDKEKYYAHQIQQPIPKLWILNFHQI